MQRTSRAAQEKAFVPGSLFLRARTAHVQKNPHMRALLVGEIVAHALNFFVKPQYASVWLAMILSYLQLGLPRRLDTPLGLPKEKESIIL